MPVMIGVVGKPNAGKTTFLNALCKTDAKVANYPFTTIEPNVAFSYYSTSCVCQELKVKCNPKNSKCTNQIRQVPVKIIDVAGLVPGAHEGRGRGNQFLSDLAEADALMHVVDASGGLDAEGNEIDAGTYNPLDDVKFLEEEIDYWILGILEKNWIQLVRTAMALRKQAPDVLATQLTGIKITRNDIVQVVNELKYPPELGKWTPDMLKIFVTSIRKKTKPIIVVANKIDRPTSEKNFRMLQEKLGKDNVLPASSLTEILLQKQLAAGNIDYDPLHGKLIPHTDKLSPKEQKVIEKIQTELFAKYGGTGIFPALNHAVKLLNMIVAYPVAEVNDYTDKDGNVLPDAYLVPQGTTAREFAGKVHKDLEKGFVCAIDARSKKRLSETYEVQNNDILKIMSSL